MPRIDSASSTPLRPYAGVWHDDCVINTRVLREVDFPAIFSISEP
jgi:hypothetical protein